ncbi:MAG TPA: hypothetical protein DIT24_01220 [Synergistaceae bacterium]|nr:hypothetical protein [Synergistaceae bacterium]
MRGYNKKGGGWKVFKKDYRALREKRRVEEMLDPRDSETPTVRLWAEPEPDQSHRRFLAVYLQRRWENLKVRHL